MKLIVEIGEYLKDDRLQCYAKPLLVTDEREGDIVFNKDRQMETISRLMDLSDKMTQVADDYYNSIPSSP